MAPKHALSSHLGKTAAVPVDVAADAAAVAVAVAVACCCCGYLSNGGGSRRL